MRSISILNHKGGVGKTTTAINLSGELANSGRRVCVIDCDPQANLTTGFGINSESLDKSLSNVLKGTCSAEEVMQHYNNIDIIPANMNELAGIEREIGSVIAREHLLSKALEPIKDRYDYILFDCPPSLELLTQNAVTASDELFVVVKPDFFSLSGLRRLIDFKNQICLGTNPRLIISGIIVNEYLSTRTLNKDVVAEIEKYFSNELFLTKIGCNVKLGEAPSAGLTIQDYDRSSSGFRAFKRLAKEVMDQEIDTVHAHDEIDIIASCEAS